MHIDEILQLFEGASEAPLPAVERAQAVAERIGPVLAKIARGDHPTLPERTMAIIGLHALAAARSSAVLPAFLQVLRLPDQQIEAMLWADYSGDLPALLFGLFDGDAGGLEALLEDDQVDGTVKWMLFVTLAWLARAGRIPRSRVVALIDRFDREAMADTESLAWCGWQEAVLILGLVEFEARARAGWEAGRLPLDREVDHEDWLERLAEAQVDPDRLITSEDLRPMDAPERDLDWLRGLLPAGPADPDAGLTADEQEWLADFMVSRHWPEPGLNIDEVDGLFTGLLAGPSPPTFGAALQELWTEPGEETPPHWADADQEAYVLGLLQRHWRSRQADLAAGLPIEPICWVYEPGCLGRSWAGGFACAIANHREAWDPAFDDKDLHALAAGLLSLAARQPDDTPRQRRERDRMLDLLPGMVDMIHAFWHAPERFTRREEPVRSAKTGRNDPCPCGSGRKYKKCCGGASSGAAPQVVDTR